MSWKKMGEKVKRGNVNKSVIIGGYWVTLPEIHHTLEECRVLSRLWGVNVLE
jgi:hypothetical protein